MELTTDNKMNFSDTGTFDNETRIVLTCRTDLTKAELPVILILSLLLDGSSVIVLYKVRSKNSRVHHFLITILAINDLVTSFLFTAMWIVNVSVCGKFGGNLLCSLLGWFGSAMVIWSAWVVVIMSGVRYLSVVKPFYFKMKVTVSTVRLGLLATILFTFALLTFPFTGLVLPYKLYADNFICAYDFAPGAGGTFHRAILGILSATGLLTIVTVLFFNGSIIRELHRKRAIVPINLGNLPAMRDRRNGFANRLTKVVAAMYCFCYGPFLVRIMYDVMDNTPAQDDPRHSVTMALLFLSPLFNPFVYVICNKSFRLYIVNKAKALTGKCCFSKRHRTVETFRMESSATS